MDTEGWMIAKLLLSPSEISLSQEERSTQRITFWMDKSFVCFLSGLRVWLGWEHQKDLEIKPIYRGA